MNESYIQNIISKLTPRQKIKYGGQINTLLDDFDIKPIQRKPIRIPQSSPFLPQKTSLNDFKTEFDTVKKTEKTDDEKKDLAKKIDGMVNGSIIANYVKPSHDGLNATEIDKAHLTMASRLYDKGGKNLAQSYLEQKGMNNYKIDDEFSDSNGLVVENPQGNAEIAFRGTDITNRDDIRTDMKIIAGKERNSGQFKKALEQARASQEKYGNLDHVTGHSLGGAKSRYIGEALDVKSTSFNPLVSPMGETDDTTITSEQSIIRTNEDMVSMGLALRSKGPTTTIKTIRGKNNTLNPIESHRLHNFTEALKDNDDPTFHERLLTDSLNKTKKLGEYHQFHLGLGD